MGPSQKRAVENYRVRLSRRGLARYEVVGREADRDLIRSMARHLATEGPEAERLRMTIRRIISGESPRKGGILAALRRSPLVGVDLDMRRSHEEGRPVDI